MNRKITCLLAAVLLAGCPVLTGCGKAESSESSYEMPYGSTLTLDTGLPVPMQYDNRFIDSALAETMAHYYHAIQANDAEEYSAVLFPLYHSYELEHFYDSKITDEDIVGNTYQMLHSYYGKDFDFALADVQSLVTADNVNPDRDAVKNMLIDLASDEKVANFEADLEALYRADLTLYLTDKGSGVHIETETPISGEVLYCAKYQGKWYVFFVAASDMQNGTTTEE